MFGVLFSASALLAATHVSALDRTGGIEALDVRIVHLDALFEPDD